MTGWPSTSTLLKATCSYLLPSAEPREGHVLVHSILRSAPSHTLHQLSHVTMLLLAVLTALENTQNNLHVCYLKQNKPQRIQSNTYARAGALDMLLVFIFTLSSSAQLQGKARSHLIPIIYVTFFLFVGRSPAASYFDWSSSKNKQNKSVPHLWKQFLFVFFFLQAGSINLLPYDLEVQMTKPVLHSQLGDSRGRILWPRCKITHHLARPRVLYRQPPAHLCTSYMNNYTAACYVQFSSKKPKTLAFLSLMQPVSCWSYFTAGPGT